MTTETKKTNWFVRVLIILLCFFIGGLIYFNFFCSSPPLQISGGVLMLIAFLTLLVLSEAFDNFSIAKLITLSRTVKEKENKNQELKIENAELRNQIISITTNISQKQINSTVFMADEIAKLLSVKPASDSEKEERKLETEEPPEEMQENRRYVSRFKLEEVAFQKFIEAKGFKQFHCIRNAKFESYFYQVDPINEFSPIFDGYIKTMDTEIFIEMKAKGLSMSLRANLYIMLSKIYYYRTIKKVNAYLFLVIFLRPDEDMGNERSNFNRVLQEFQPAITNGLLQIETVKITQEEYDAIE